jgi:hypothetical protein
MEGRTWAYKAAVLVVATTTLTVAAGFGTTGSYLSDTEDVSLAADAAVGGSVSDLEVRPKRIETDSKGGTFTASVTAGAPASVNVGATRLSVSGSTIDPERGKCTPGGKCTFKFSRADLTEAVNGTGTYPVSLTIRWQGGVEATAQTTVTVTDSGANANEQAESAENETAGNESTTKSVAENNTTTTQSNTTTSQNNTTTTQSNTTTSQNNTTSTTTTTQNNTTTTQTNTTSTVTTTRNNTSTSTQTNTTTTQNNTTNTTTTTTSEQYSGLPQQPTSALTKPITRPREVPTPALVSVGRWG